MLGSDFGFGDLWVCSGECGFACLGWDVYCLVFCLFVVCFVGGVGGFVWELVLLFSWMFGWCLMCFVWLLWVLG